MSPNSIDDLQSLRIAIVHDAIVQRGGGEYVLGVLMDMFPQAHVYTSILNPSAGSGLDSKRITTSFLQYAGFARRFPRTIQLLSPFVWSSFRLPPYDLIISHGGFYASHLIESVRYPGSLHIHYCIMPPLNIFGKSTMRPFEHPFNMLWYPYLRRVMRSSMHSIPSIWTVSGYARRLLTSLYGRNADILPPPVELFQDTPVSGKRDTYIYIGRLDREKRVDRIIKSFNRTGETLTVAGTGNDETYLKQIAGPTIRFTGYADRNRKRLLFSRAIAFVHAMTEDAFPLAPIEALSAGIPVISPDSGGLADTITEGKTGYHFHPDTDGSLEQTLKRIRRHPISPHICRKASGKFARPVFEQALPRMVLSAYEKFRKTRHRDRA